MKSLQLVKPKILVIRIRRAGDALLTIPLLNSLKSSFPDSEIHYVLNEPINELFENHPSIDKVITIPQEIIKSSFVKYIKWVKQTMKSTNYDIIIDCRTTLNTLLFSLFSLNTKIRIGEKKKYNFLIHNKRVITGGCENKIDELCMLLNPLEGYVKIKKTRLFDIYITDKEKYLFKQKMEDAGINLNKPIILCNVASRDIRKQWDTNKMANVIKRMLEHNSTYQLILNYSGNSEKSVALNIYESLNSPERVFVNIEASSLRELAAMATFCNFFFGNEGGARHVTEASGVSTLSIFSPGCAPNRWLPNKGERHIGISADELALKATNKQINTFDFVTEDIVWYILKDKLNKHFSAQPSEQVTE